MLPLHLAVYYSDPDDAIAHLLMRYPDRRQQLGPDGLTLIERANPERELLMWPDAGDFLEGNGQKASESRRGVKNSEFTLSVKSAPAGSGINAFWKPQKKTRSCLRICMCARSKKISWSTLHASQQENVEVRSLSEFLQRFLLSLCQYSINSIK